MENIFIVQDLVVPTNTTEALKYPIWRKSMDDEYEALIKKRSGMLYCDLLTQILSEAAGLTFATQ